MSQPFTSPFTMYQSAPTSTQQRSCAAICQALAQTDRAIARAHNELAMAQNNLVSLTLQRSELYDEFAAALAASQGQGPRMPYPSHEPFSGVSAALDKITEDSGLPARVPTAATGPSLAADSRACSTAPGLLAEIIRSHRCGPLGGMRSPMNNDECSEIAAITERIGRAPATAVPPLSSFDGPTGSLPAGLRPTSVAGIGSEIADLNAIGEGFGFGQESGEPVLPSDVPCLAPPSLEGGSARTPPEQEGLNAASCMAEGGLPTKISGRYM